MAEAARDGSGGTRLPPEKLTAAIEMVRMSMLEPYGIVLTHVLTPDYVEATGSLPEVSLVAELKGSADYFDLFGAEDSLAAILGLDVRIIPRTAVAPNWRAGFEASMVPL